jgi:hypothetical protein
MKKNARKLTDWQKTVQKKRSFYNDSTVDGSTKIIGDVKYNRQKEKNKWRDQIEEED